MYDFALLLQLPVDHLRHEILYFYFELESLSSFDILDLMCRRYQSEHLCMAAYPEKKMIIHCYCSYCSCYSFGYGENHAIRVILKNGQRFCL